MSIENNSSGNFLGLRNLQVPSGQGFDSIATQSLFPYQGAMGFNTTNQTLYYGDGKIWKMLCCTDADAGSWVPVITPDLGQQAHTIEPFPITAYYNQIKRIVDVNVTYVMSPTGSEGPLLYADFITLPLPPEVFLTPNQVSGVIVFNLDVEIDHEYEGGIVLDEVAGNRLHVFYGFQTDGSHDITISVQAKYQLP